MTEGEKPIDKVMFDFGSFEEYTSFSQKNERLRGDSSFREVGKHTTNIVMVLPGSEEDYQLARENIDYHDSLYDTKSQARRERDAIDDIVMALGEPPSSESLGSGTEGFGKGASGLPQQFVELLISAGSIYGAIRAFYDAGKSLVSAIKHLQEKYGSPQLLNRGGVVSVCAVDLVENRNVSEYNFVSAVEAQEGHMWDPTIDARDVCYVTFVDNKGDGHLYAANAYGAILNYSVLPLAKSWEIKPTFSDDTKS